MTALPDEFPIEQRTVGQILRQAAARYQDKPVVIDVEGPTLSFRQLDDWSTRIANGLIANGIEFQQPVLIMLPDVVELVALWAGLARRGAVEVPINLAYRGLFLSRIVNDSTATTLVVHQDYLERVADVAAELETLERLFVFPVVPDDLPDVISKRFQVRDFGDIDGDDQSPVEVDVSYRDMIGIMYTSGTTGVSKGVMVSHAHAYRYARNVSMNHGVTDQDRYYTAGLPLFHIAGQWGVVYGSIMRGATVLLRRGYKNDLFWKDIAEHGGTVVFMLGAIANFIWQQPESAEDAHTPLEKVGMYPVIPEHEAFAERFGVLIASGYGSTENPGPCSHSLGSPFPNNQCVGYLKDTVQTRILDENDVPCAPGVVGEICCRPNNPWEVMLGYWNKPGATVKAFRNLWFHTGDAGYVDEQGRLYFVDRVTDSLRRRGENISSMEVEDIVNQHEQVLECAVFPVWADESEQEVMVALTCQRGSTVEPAELIAFCNQRMPYFMVPRYIDIVEEIPKTPTGKIQKFPLRERGITASTWDRVAEGVKLKR